ncbi:MAG: nitroreductase family protein [Gammaproteobacteria bacterium]
MFEKQARTQYPINSLLARRWSGRAYDPARELAHEQIMSLLEAARWAPSCFGDEPWRFIVCNRATAEPAWQNVLECLTEKNRAWAQNAPLLMVISANTLFRSNDKPNKWGRYDTGAAAMSICVQATDMGLMVHQMGGFDADKTRTVFAIPDQFTPVAMMAVGYQLPEDKIPEDMKEREYAERKRSPLADSFFDGEWGKPISGI